MTNPIIKAVSIVTPKRAAAWGDMQSFSETLAGAYDFSSIPNLFSYPVKNFGRFPLTAKAACAGCALLFRAAGIEYRQREKHQTALLCSGSPPASIANQTFFRDYLDSGRVMGRGNLFIYTLPTSGPAEVSIHFGLCGPFLYIESTSDPLGELLRAARRTAVTEQIDNSVCLWQDSQTTLALYLRTPSNGADQTTELHARMADSANWRSPTDAAGKLLNTSSKINEI